MRLQGRAGNTHVSRVVSELRNLRVQRQEDEPHAEHRTLGLHWYIEADPPTAIIRQGMAITFRLRNSRNESIESWDTDGESRPIFGIVVREGDTREWSISRNYPPTVQHWFNFPGHRVVYFRGTPERGQAATGGGTAIRGQPIHVTYAFDVAPHLTVTALRATEETAAADLAAVADPGASDDELAQLIQRIAIRRGLKTLTDNKQEALDLQRVYQGGGRMVSRRLQHAHRLHPIYREFVRRRQALQWTRDDAEMKRYPAEAIQHLDGKIRYCDRNIDLILVPYPEVAAMELGRSPFEIGDPHTAEGIRGRVERGVARVLEDIDSTRNKLASGDLNALDIPRLVREAQQDLRGSAHPRLGAAIEDLLRRHHRRDLPLAAASVALLFVPGIGPYLSAALSLGQAAISVERAEDIVQASHAGLREGLVRSEEADEAVFQATIDALGAALDVVQAGAAARGTLRGGGPDVPAAAPPAGRTTLPGLGPAAPERTTLPGLGPGTPERTTLPGLGPEASGGSPAPGARPSQLPTREVPLEEAPTAPAGPEGPPVPAGHLPTQPETLLDVLGAPRPGGGIRPLTEAQRDLIARRFVARKTFTWEFYESDWRQFGGVGPPPAGGWVLWRPDGTMQDYRLNFTRTRPPSR
jgi:hypothetical protein